MEGYTREAYAVNQMVERGERQWLQEHLKPRLLSLCLVLASLWVLSSVVQLSVAPKFHILWFPTAERLTVSQFQTEKSQARL